MIINCCFYFFGMANSVLVCMCVCMHVYLVEGNIPLCSPTVGLGNGATSCTTLLGDGVETSDSPVFIETCTFSPCTRCSKGRLPTSIIYYHAHDDASNSQDIYICYICYHLLERAPISPFITMFTLLLHEQFILRQVEIWRVMIKALIVQGTF